MKPNSIILICNGEQFLWDQASHCTQMLLDRKSTGLSGVWGEAPKWLLMVIVFTVHTFSNTSVLLFLGKTSLKKNVFFWALPEWGGGVYPCPIFLALFQEVHFWSIKRVYFFKNANVLNFTQPLSARLKSWACIENVVQSCRNFALAINANRPTAELAWIWILSASSNLGKSLKKHRKNCECCPGHYLIVNHYSLMSWFKFCNLLVIFNCVTEGSYPLWKTIK